MQFQRHASHSCIRVLQDNQDRFYISEVDKVGSSVCLDLWFAT
jgi:hypothetical protein